jgi:hypothetical protein
VTSILLRVCIFAHEAVGRDAQFTMGVKAILYSPVGRDATIHGEYDE